MTEYIARERVIEEIKGIDNCGCITRSVNHVCEDIRSIPPADVIPIPKGATNGDMIKAVTGEDFSRGSSIYNHDLMICEGEYYLAFNVDWWNAPYKKEVDDD